MSKARFNLFLGVLVLVFSGRIWAESAPTTINAFKKNSRILFQGDSITDMNRGRDGDPNHLLGHSYAFIIRASYGAAYPMLNLTFINRGVSGNKVADLAARWTSDALDLKPDILSILIGVNDSSAGVPIAQYEETYDKLLAAARAANPEVKLVLGEPFTLPVGVKKNGYEEWATNIRERQFVVTRLAAKYDAALVRYQAAFDAACQLAPAEYWIWDGVHPTYSGQQIMADEWLKTVRQKWPSG